MGGERAIKIATTSREYIRVRASASSAITGDPISIGTPPKLAFMPTPGNPDTGDWHDAVWDSGYAKLMLGPDDVALDAGTYRVWITFAAGAEQPVTPAGTLLVH